MQRKIKYRAWDPVHDKMFLVKAIYFNEDDIDVDQIDYIDDGNTKFEIHKPRYGYSRNKVKLMQYINIKDLQGKEIYEGDIIEVFYPHNELHSINVVEWGDHRAGFFPIIIPVDYFRVFPKRFKVIGNIYETKGYKKLLR